MECDRVYLLNIVEINLRNDSQSFWITQTILVDDMDHPDLDERRHARNNMANLLKK